MSEEKNAVLEGLKKFGNKVASPFRKMGRFTWVVVASVLLVLVCFIGVVGLGSLKYNWHNWFVDGIVRVIPVPAAIVNGHIITLRDFNEEVAAIEHLKVQRQLTDVTTEKIRADVMDKLVQDVVLKDMARKFKVTITDAEMEKKIDEISAQKEVGTREKFAQNIKDFFDWDMATFKKRILYIDMLGQKLSEQVPASDTAIAEIQKRSDDVLAKVKEGKVGFDQLAKENSDDPGSADNGGELDWFGSGVMVPEFEKAAFALQPGETSGLVRSPFGYHIINVEERKTVEFPADPAAEVKKDDAGNTVNEKKTEEQIRARHILIATRSFNDFFKEFQDKASVRKFVK